MRRGRLAVAALLLGAAACPVVRERIADARIYSPERRLRVRPADLGIDAEELQIPTADGERLHGYLLPARGPILAHAISFHGAGGNVGDRLDLARRLAGEGLDVLLFDYRGYGLSTGTPSEAGLRADARAALAALLAREGVDRERIVYIGESLGGAVAIGLAVERAPRALVLQSTFPSIRAVAKVRYPWLPSLLVPDRFPSVRIVGGVDAPILMVTGAEDPFVPVEVARQLYDAAPEPRRLEVIEGAAHDDFLEVAGDRYVALVGAWLRERMGTP